VGGERDGRVGLVIDSMLEDFSAEQTCLETASRREHAAGLRLMGRGSSGSMQGLQEGVGVLGVFEG